MSDQTSGDLPTNGGYAGQEWFLSGGSRLNEMSFVTRQILAGKAIVALVKVVSVTGGGAAAKPAILSVRPLVNQIDGFGNQMPHGVINGIPAFRHQAGSSAVVLDPVVGDVGLCVFCDRDISIVKATGAQAGPGSRRQNDWADGLYLGGFLNAAPTQYVIMNGDGISIVSPTAIILNAPTIQTTGTLTNNGLHVGSTHVHGGVQGGISNTGTPAV